MEVARMESIVSKKSSDNFKRFKVALSPSRVSQYKKCPLSFRLSAIDKIPQETKDYQLKGTLVHAVLEELMGLPPEERTYPRAVKLIVPRWEQMKSRDPELSTVVPEAQEMDFFVQARNLVKGYFMMENPQGLATEKMEEFVTTTLRDDVPLRGFIDRIDINDSSMVRIVDYKTGKKPSPRFVDDAMAQMKFYALVWWQLHGVIPAQLRLMYLAVGDDLTLSPDEATLEAFAAELVVLWDEIRHKGKTGEFEPRPSKLCNWCDFQTMCPAFGGTLPPYPGWPNAD